MRENNRNSIASIGKLPQFTTMNVIDGQAGLVIYSSLIFYSLTIDNILNIIVILILAGVAISTLMGENGLINRTIKAKEQTEIAGTLENVQLAVAASMANENYAVNEADLKDALTKAFGAEETGYTIEGDSSSGWTTTIVGENKSYKVSASGEVKEYVPPVEIATLINTANPEKNPFADKTKAVKDASNPAQIFYVPKGFKLASEITEETKVNDGIVVEDGEGNQFVWVPVPVAVWDTTKYTENQITVNGYTPMAATYTYPNDSTGNTYYRGMLYSFSGTTSTYKSGYIVGDTSSYSEPRLVTGSSEDKYAPMESRDIKGSSYDASSTYVKNILGYNKANVQDNASDFGKQMQKDYDDMVKSVAEYGGFYVGRYETGIENGKAVSKNASTNANVTTADASQKNQKNQQYTWYGLYKIQDEFSKGEDVAVRSSMIWGSQYDAMMNWMAKTGKTVGKKDDSKYNQSTETGNSAYNDVINKIYDLYGCHYEWTLEAYNTSYRTKRGGGSGGSCSPAVRSNGIFPVLPYSSNGSRLSLYIM